MDDIFNSFEVSGEIKQYMKTQIFGDINCYVKVEFKPQFMPRDDKDKMALDMVNSRLQMVSGEISHIVEQTIRDRLHKLEAKEL